MRRGKQTKAISWKEKCSEGGWEGGEGEGLDLKD